MTVPVCMLAGNITTIDTCLLTCLSCPITTDWKQGTPFHTPVSQYHHVACLSAHLLCPSGATWKQRHSCSRACQVSATPKHMEMPICLAAVSQHHKIVARACLFCMPAVSKYYHTVTRAYLFKPAVSQNCQLVVCLICSYTRHFPGRASTQWHRQNRLQVCRTYRCERVAMWQGWEMADLWLVVSRLLMVMLALDKCANSVPRLHIMGYCGNANKYTHSSTPWAWDTTGKKTHGSCGIQVCKHT